jgi:glycosyltransferase involved in cell wall biosynthesis
MSTPSTTPRVGFVLERSLGHVTHADNLTKLLPAQDIIDADVVELAWETSGLQSRIPGFSTNWTIRSGVRARVAITQLKRSGPLDALFVHTQVPAVLSPDHLWRIPTVVSLDATPLQYDELGSHYGHARGNEYVERLKWTANRACFRRARHIVTWSEWAKRGVIDGYGIEEAKITVVPPGVATSVWSVERAAADPDAPVRILFVGGDLERKGGDVLLAAFRALRAEVAATSLDGVELHLVTRSHVAPEPGVIVHRNLGPNSPELVSLYHRSDVFCLPTRGDCLPMVLSEAGAAGLPLVSTAVAAIPEIVRDGETGLVVPPGDRDALVRALRALVEDPGLRLRLGTAAQVTVSRDFDAAKNVHRLAELLREVATGGDLSAPATVPGP